jgi:hypothetical protein
MPDLPHDIPANHLLDRHVIRWSLPRDSHYRPGYGRQAFLFFERLVSLDEAKEAARLYIADEYDANVVIFIHNQHWPSNVFVVYFRKGVSG